MRALSAVCRAAVDGSVVLICS